MGLIHKQQDHIWYSVELFHHIFGMHLEMCAFEYSIGWRKRGRMANAWGMAALSEFTAREMLASKSQMDVRNSHCTWNGGGDGRASMQFSKARKMNKRFQDQNFTLTHCFYALMGGFVIAIPRPARSRDDNQEGITTQDSRHLSSSENDVDHGIYILEDEDFGKCFTIWVIVTAKNASSEESSTNI